MEMRLNVSVRFLHVIRHPLDNIATMAVREQHGRDFIVQGKVLNDFRQLQRQASFYFYAAKTNLRLQQKLKSRILDIYSEDLISDSKPVLSRICQFLDIQCSPAYLSDCASIVSTKTSNTRKNVVWHPHLKQYVYVSLSKIPFLFRYRK